MKTNKTSAIFRLRGVLPRLSRAAAVLGVGIATLIGSVPASAGEFSVSPVRIFMAPADRAVAVTVTNEGDTALVMQADLYVWSQTPDGEEVLEPTEDVFLSPPILTLAAGASQVVRLARLITATPAEQLTYRMVIREIPEALPPESGLQVQVALALSLPIFVTPANASPVLDCQLQRTAADALTLGCENHGTAYAQPRELLLARDTGEAIISSQPANYILPGASVDYALVGTGPIAGGMMTLTLTMDDGSDQHFELMLGD
jgi:fimbrial chaperone protein